MRKADPTPFCVSLAALWLYLACVPDSLASVDICQKPVSDSYFSTDFNKHNQSSLEGNLGNARQENYDLDLVVKSKDNGLSFGFGHRYTIINFDRITPGTNGHLHTLFLPFHKLSQNNHRNFRVSIAPAVSASSNVINHPGRYTADALQLLAALVWDRHLSDQVSLQYGICGDHRFGSYQIYPLISVHWQLHPDWEAELGYPAARLSHQLSPKLNSVLRITPDGNEWYVLDEDRTQRSKFVYESYALEWTFNWQVREKLTLTASVGRQLRNRYQITLQDGSRIQLAGDSASRIAAGLRWRF
jgi:hypothetical protein